MEAECRLSDERLGNTLASDPWAKQESHAMKRLEYRLCKDRHGDPLVTLDSAMRNGQDIYPANFRALAKALLEAADAAEQTKSLVRSLWSIPPELAR